MAAMTAGSGGRLARLEAGTTRALAARAAAHPRPQPASHRGASHVCRGLDASVASAVTQQALAYAVVLGAEGAFSYSQVPDGDKGRPSVPLVGAGIAGTAAATALVSLGGDSPLGGAGLLLGVATAAAMLVLNVQRVLNLRYSDGDWPGPKAWPAGMALISFFAFSVFWQALWAA